MFLACGLAVVLGGRLAVTEPLLSAGCGALAVLLVNAPWRLVGPIGRRFPARRSSQNLIAELPTADWYDPPARVVFMAHYDTKSQLLPTGVRVALVVTLTIIGLLLVLMGILVATGWSLPIPGAVRWVLCGTGVAVLSALGLNRTGNRSPGALDNGTGVGTLLELARTWRPRPDAPAEVCWVATGAEEVGLDGARDFLRRHEGWCREKPTLVINLDSVGAGDRIYLAGEPGALCLAGRVAEDLGLAWSRLRILGAGMDHEPFAARGIAAVSLLGDVVGNALALHSPRDRLELVDGSALHRAGMLAAHLGWAWAERHQAADRDVPASHDARPLLATG